MYSPEENDMTTNRKPTCIRLKINDPFLGQYQRLVRDVVIPYQWDAL